MYKNKKTIEEEFDKKFEYAHENPALCGKGDVKNLIHQIRKEDKEFFDDKSAEMYKAGMDMAYKLVKEMIEDGKITFTSINGKIYIEEEDLLDNLNNLNKE